MNWIEKLLDILQNNNNYNNIRENGYNKAIEYYQWEHFANKIDSVYKDNLK
jgi:glycosyltransferase involved in cell wall biosynthesis